MTIDDLIDDLLLKKANKEITGSEKTIIMDGYGDTRELETITIKDNELWLFE